MITQVRVLPSHLAEIATNFLIKGFAFLSRYRKLRGGQDEDVDEVDYNFGRAFQQLGLHGYAVKHYEKVLNATEKRMKEGSTVCHFVFILGLRTKIHVFAGSGVGARSCLQLVIDSGDNRSYRAGR